MSFGTIIRRRFSWSDESLSNVDKADYHRIARAMGLSRSYNHATKREVSWRHARGEFETPNYGFHTDAAQENRNLNWDKAARQYAEELRAQARIKHEYVAMPTGYCLTCGEREDARISHTSHGITVWRRVHSNPKMVGTNIFEDQAVSADKKPCSGSGWMPPESADRRVRCFWCHRDIVVNIDGGLRRHFMK